MLRCSPAAQSATDTQTSDTRSVSCSQCSLQNRICSGPLSSPVLPGVSETRKSDGKANDICGKFGAKVLCTALWEIQRQAETVGYALSASRASSAGAQARHEHRRVALRFGGDAGITDVEVWRTFCEACQLYFGHFVSFCDLPDVCLICFLQLEYRFEEAIHIHKLCSPPQDAVYCNRGGETAIPTSAQLA